MDKQVASVYGNKVRVRACGVALQGNTILMVNHQGITSSDFWAPPGGGVEFGRSIHETLRKEFIEETGLQIDVSQFLFGCEYIQDPIHSIELFYSVVVTGGKLRTGADPEIQIISDVRYIEFNELKKLPANVVHGIFRKVKALSDLTSLNGIYRI